MSSTTKHKNFLEFFLSDVCKYRIANKAGNNNLIANIIDAIIYLTYIAITIFVLWKEGIATLPFIATILLTIRSFLKHLKISQVIKNKKNGIAFAHSLRMCIYSVSIFFACMLYVVIKDDNVGSMLLTLCYTIYAVFELTDILADCYEATPIVYTE